MIWSAIAMLLAALVALLLAQRRERTPDQRRPLYAMAVALNLVAAGLLAIVAFS